MHSQKKQLENYLHKHIPISSAMGIHVDHAATDHIILKAPLSNNINHKMTVFGGSLHSAATLACWSLLHVNFAEQISRTPNRHRQKRGRLPGSGQRGFYSTVLRSRRG